MELVIMAGGIGSRFGGLKQIEPIDNNGNFIIDYSVFDAIRAGFDKVVFVIKKENFETFKNTIGKRVSPYINVAYVFQNNNICPDRIKPLGTGQAVLLTKNEIKKNFAVINSDDYYGFESMKLLKDATESASPKNFKNIAFKAKNTLSGNGSVKRGVCTLNPDGNLKDITECELYQIDNQIFAKELDANNDEFIIPNDNLISMNMWAFNKSIFNILEKDFDKFCKDPENLKLKEFYLPTSIENALKNNDCNVQVIETPSRWLGMTYKNDIDFVKAELKNLVEKNLYPKNLWNEENFKSKE